MDDTTSGDALNILAGEAIQWSYMVTNDGNVDLTDISVVDDNGTPGDPGDDVVVGTIASLAAGASTTLTLDGTSGTGDYHNTATASTSVSDDAGHSIDVSDSDDSSYFGQDPSIDVEKYVSVDGGNTWYDADEPTGPTLVNTAGIDPQFKFVVHNDGNVELTNVTLTDDVFDLNGLAGDIDNVSVDYQVGTLAADDGVDGSGTDEIELIYTGATWEFGQHVDTATVTADPYQDDAGHTRDVSDSDAAHYFGIYGGLITDSSLCTFDTDSSADGKQFNLIFTPDYKLGGGNYKLSDSNPGQFYYNLFYQGTPGDTVDAKIDIPYPFVTQGAVPIHVYGDVSIDQHDGEICLTPLNEIANYKLTDEAVDWLLIDANDSGVNDVGDYYQLTVSGVNVDDDGFIYLNVHLDYGLEKETGWNKSSPESGVDNAVDNNSVPGDQPPIDDGHSYDFSAEVDGSPLVGSEDSIINDNQFKNIKGAGGMMHSVDGSDPNADQTALAGQHVLVYKDGDFMGDAWSDDDGWYYAEFMATGKQTGYTFVWDPMGDTNGNDPNSSGADDYVVDDVQMGGKAGKWAEVDFTVHDPVADDIFGPEIASHGDVDVSIL